MAISSNNIQVYTTLSKELVAEIDKVSKPERCASRKAGGTGYRYTCQVGGKICHLTYEENYRWFMERK